MGEDLEKIKRRMTKALQYAFYSVLKNQKKIPTEDGPAIDELKEVYSRITDHAIKLGWMIAEPKYPYEIKIEPKTNESDERKARVAPVVKIYFP